MEMTSLQKIERAHQQLLKHKATIVYSGILMVGTYEIRQDVPTARTNGIDVHYGDAFVQSLTEPQLMAVILHEALHKVYQHTFLAKHLYKQDPRLANMAIDYVVNIDVKDIEKETNGFVQLPGDGLYDERYRGMSSDQIFQLLKQGQDQDQDQTQPQPQPQPSLAGMDEHDWEQASKLSEAEVKEIQAQLDQAMRQGILLSKKLTGNKSRIFDKLLEVKEDWRELLRNYLTSFADKGDMATWRRPSRRWLQHDLYLPSTYSESFGSMVIAVDTSGSIDDGQLNQFMSQIVAICGTVQPERVDLLYWGSSVVRHEVYARDDLGKLASTTKVADGGGTEVACVFNYLDKHKLTPECIVVLTDGYTDYPAPSRFPTLWAMTTNMVAPWGKQIRLEDEHEAKDESL